MKEVGDSVYGLGAKVHAVYKATIPPDKATVVDDDVLGIWVKAHATDNAAVSLDKTKVVSLHHICADHRI